MIRVFFGNFHMDTVASDTFIYSGTQRNQLSLDFSFTNLACLIDFPFLRKESSFFLINGINSVESLAFHRDFIKFDVIDRDRRDVGIFEERNCQILFIG